MSLLVIPRGVKRAALPVLLLLAACWSRTPPTAQPPRAAAPGVVPLVAARESGLYEITADGRDTRRLSATPAQHPRWLVPGRRLLFLNRDTTELRSLDLDSAKEQVIARIHSRLDCPSGFVGSDGPDPTVELRIEEEGDFAVAGTRACLHLMDRNSNMASYSLDIHVDLSTGRTTDYLSIAPESCKLPRAEAPSATSCDVAAEASREPTPAPELQHAGPPGFTVHSWSPTRRWVLLRGNDMEGDYMHYQIVLYEPATRRSFPITSHRAARGDSWPAPLTAAQLALDPTQLNAITGDVVAETSIYWLEGRGDRLVVGESLVVPGVRIVDVGQLAY